MSANGGEWLLEEARRFLEAREIGPALQHFNRAQELGACPDECGGGRWFCHMLAGNFDQAWLESDCIALRGAPDPNRLWSGRRLDGKRVVIRCLHGLGDAIQFIRFAPLLREHVACLHVEVPACLVSLFSTIPAIDSVFSWEIPGPHPEWDEHIEIMELPRYFRVTRDTIPTNVPYLFPAAAFSNNANTPLRIGVVWQASSWNTQRWIPASELQPLLGLEGCRFFSLQFASVGEHSATVRAPEPFVQAGDDVLRTASSIQSLDLVIAVDTMVAHLAGALGKPVWLMLTRSADWRWMLDCDTSPWYPTMRLFRQGRDAAWAPVVDEICRALMDYLPGNGTQPRVR